MFVSKLSNNATQTANPMGPKLEKSKVPIFKAFMQVIGHKKGTGAQVLPRGTYTNFYFFIFFKDHF